VSVLYLRPSESHWIQLTILFIPPFPIHLQLALNLQRKWEGSKDKYASRLAAIISGPKSSSSLARPVSSDSTKSRSNVPPPPIPVSASASVSERPREVKIQKKLVIQESDSEEEEFGGAVKKQKTSYHSASTLPPSRPQTAPAPVRVPEKVSPYSSLVLEIDKDMDDKEALRVTLEAAWQFLSDSDKDNIFATAVRSSYVMSHSLIDIARICTIITLHALLCILPSFNIFATMTSSSLQPVNSMSCLLFTLLCTLFYTHCPHSSSPSSSGH
jgi:hypothetical protein